jgi:hypothetical protein
MTATMARPNGQAARQDCTAPDLPWDGEGDDEIIANLTIGSLRDSILNG